MSPPPEDVRARWLLVASAAVGIALAAFGIARSGDAPPADPDEAVAVVNGQPILRETFARFAGAVASERKSTELDPDTRRRLLERMIDEELLLQRGISLGLQRRESMARRSIVSALIASVTAEAEVEEPDEETLRAFHAENAERFARPGRLTIDAALVGVGERPDAVAYRAAREIAQQLRAGEDFARVSHELADAPVVELPGGPLPIETIRQYLGPTPARTASDLAPGEVSDPVRGSAGYYVIALRERAPMELPPFEEIREQVRTEYLRSRGDAALRAYVAELREGADVRVLDPALASEEIR